MNSLKNLQLISITPPQMYKLFFLCFFLFLSDTGKSQTDVVFQMKTEQQDNKIQREKWIEDMHKAAPDVDWREMDRNTRWNKYIEQTRQNKDAKKSGSTQQSSTVPQGIWIERGSDNLSGRVVVSEFDTINNLIYCASDVGIIWRGNANGTNWTPLNDGIRFSGVLMVKLIPMPSGQRLVVVSNRSVNFSDDGGSTWSESTGLSTIQSWGAITASIVTSNNQHDIYFIAGQWNTTVWNAATVVYRSTDKGASFAPVSIAYNEPAYRSSYADLFTAHKSDTVFFVIKDECYYLNLVTGAPVFISQIPLLSNGETRLCGSKTSASTLLYAYVNHELYRSINSGLTWTYVRNLSILNNDTPTRDSFSASIKNSNYLFFGGVNAYRSYDGGNLWTTVNDWSQYYSNMPTMLHADIFAITSYIDTAGNERQYIASDGGLYISHDNLQTVSNLALKGLNVCKYYSTYTHQTNPNFIYAGSQDQGIQRCQSDSGNILGFIQLQSGDYGHIVSSDGGNSIWMDYPSFVAYFPVAQTSSANGSWDFGANGATKAYWMTPLMADPFNPKIVYAAGGHLSGSTGSHILKMTANASNIISATELPFDFAAAGGGDIGSIACSPVNPNYWYVLTTNGKFFYSSDYGNTWAINNSFTGPSPQYMYGTTIYPSKTQFGTVYIGGSGYSNPGVYKTSDHGLNFSPMNTGLPSTLVYKITGNTNNDLLFAATENGPYVFVASTQQWYDLSAGNAPDQTYWSVEYIPLTNTARFASYGRGIWDYDMSSMVGVNNYMQDNPIEIFPNPVKDVFTIQASDPSLTSAQIKIYSVIGDEVYSGRVQHLNNSSFDLSAYTKGIYFVRISNENTVLTKKIILSR